MASFPVWLTGDQQCSAVLMVFVRGVWLTGHQRGLNPKVFETLPVFAFMECPSVLLQRNPFGVFLTSFGYNIGQTDFK